jgi:hypothetical protein
VNYAFFIVPLTFALLFALERAVPLRKATRPLRSRLSVNLLVGITALAGACTVDRRVSAARSHVLLLASRQPRLAMAVALP